MSPHPLVDQLRFTRRELLRCLEGLSEEDAQKRIMPMNCISWIVGHLANQEQGYWVLAAQGKMIVPDLNRLVGFRKPASTPLLAEMLSGWKEITAAADPFLDILTPGLMKEHLSFKGKTMPENTGTLLSRNLFHYWYHIGEASAIRQQLGHTNLPDFVGDMSEAEYQPERDLGEVTSYH